MYTLMGVGRKAGKMFFKAPLFQIHRVAGAPPTMADVFSQQKRSQVMKAVRSRGNRTTEATFSQALRVAGITGWRRHLTIRLRNSRGRSLSTSDSEKVRCTPDFVFRHERVAVFVDGCFWHGCPRHGTIPQFRAGFWKKKLTRNVERDKQINRLLRAEGWRVLRIWEHSLRKSPAKCIRRLERAIAATSSHPPGR